MSNQIKGGRKPLSSKPSTAIFNDDTFGDNLRIPQTYRDDAAARGMEIRYVDRKKLSDFGGVHHNQWVAYRIPKTESGTVENAQSFQFGNNPDGTVVRGSLLLAERPITTGDAHRARLANLVRGKSQKFHQDAAQNIRDTSGVRVTTGDED